MQPPPHYISALATAIRDRLMAGGDVILPGIGLLQRTHEPASVTNLDEGRKMLLPPRDTLLFSADATLDALSDEALVAAFSEALTVEVEEPREAIDETLIMLRRMFMEEGYLVISDVGQFANMDGAISFEPDESILAAVNSPFAGLPPIAPRVELIPEETEAEAATESIVDTIADDEGNSLLTEDEHLVDADSTELPTSTILDVLANQSGKPVVDLAAEPADAESAASELTANDEAIDNDIDALLASVWAPVAAAGGNATFETPGSTADVEEAMSVSVEPSIEDNQVNARPIVATGAATAASAAALISAQNMASTRNTYEKRKGRMAFVLVPAVVILCAIAVVALWRRLTGGNSTGSDLANSGSSRPLEGATMDTLFANHAGGIADEDMDLSTFESGQFLSEGDNPPSEAVPEEPSSESAPELRPTPAPVAPPRAEAPPPATPQQPAQRQTSSQLHGTGGVIPTQGGATWILASGNRTSAEELSARYRQQGYRSSVLSGEANGLTVYRVAVGQFGNAAEARGLKSSLPADAPASAWVLNF